MKKVLLIILVVLLTSSEVWAQRRNGLIRRRLDVESFATFGFGPNYTFADPDCSKSFFGPVFNQNIFSNQEVSLGFRQIFSGYWGYRAFMSFDKFTGNDLKTNRNMSFVSTAFQLNAVGEYAYKFGKKYSLYTPNSIYGFLGVGLISVSSDLNNPTGGHQNYKYKANDFKPTIPYGFGYRYEFIDLGLSVGAEFLFRYTFSDYLDGFKPPYPESKSNDILQGFQLTAMYKIF